MTSPNPATANPANLNPTTPNWSAIRAENPDLIFNNITQIGEGWSSWVYRVNNDVVFKIPKRQDEDGELAREVAVLNFIKPHVPLTVATPLTYRAASAGWPYGYAAHSRVAGDPIDFDTLTVAEKSAAAQTMADYLRALHALTPDDDLRPLLARHGYKNEYEDLLAAAEVQVLPKLSTRDAERVRTHAQAHVDNAAYFDFQPTLIHSDLHSEHLLTQNGVICGVIDFGDAAWSDPDIDFGELYWTAGADFMLECARAYGHPDPEGLLEKVRHRAIFGDLHDIMYAPDYGLPSDADASWASLHEWLQQGE